MTKTIAFSEPPRAIASRRFVVVAPHEKLPGVVGAALEGPLDPLVNGHLALSRPWAPWDFTEVTNDDWRKQVVGGKR